MDIQTSLNYLDQLHLPAPRLTMSALQSTRNAAPLQADTVDSAAGIQDNKLITFTSNLDTKYKEVVKYSTQIAQRAANAKHDMLTERMDWYNTYIETLRHAGWIGSDNKLTEYHGADLDVTMESVALELIQLAAGPNAALLLEITNAAISTLKGDNELSLKLQKASVRGKSGTFDILPCLQRDDDVVMYDHSMVFEHSTTSGSFLFWDWSLKEVDLQHVANEWTLNYSHYQQVEAGIKKALGESSNSFFENIKL